MAGAGLLSLTCNVTAGDNLGQQLYGVLVVAGFVTTEWYASKLQAVPPAVVEPRRGADRQAARRGAEGRRDQAAQQGGGRQGDPPAAGPEGREGDRGPRGVVRDGRRAGLTGRLSDDGVGNGTSTPGPHPHGTSRGR
jgi:hypothetical protein